MPLPSDPAPQQPGKLGFALAALGLLLLAGFSVIAALQVANGRRVVERNVVALVAMQRLSESLLAHLPGTDGLAALEALGTIEGKQALEPVRAFEAERTPERQRAALASVGKVVGNLRRANAEQSEVLGGHIDRLYLTVGFLVVVGAMTLALLWRVRANAVAMARLAQQRIEAAQAEHSDKLATLHALAASTAHEVNNPLTAVMLNLEFLALHDEGFSQAMKGAVKASSDGATRIAQIVSQLRKVAAPASTDQVELGLVIDSTMKLLEHRLSPHAQVVQNLAERGVVRAEYVGLGQVVSNLVVNAMEAFGNRPAMQNQITIETHAVDRDWIELSVADNGPGWDPATYDRLMQPFFTTKRTGSGLGLFVCKRIIEGFRGELTLVRSPAAGARVAVRLRRA